MTLKIQEANEIYQNQEAQTFTRQDTQKFTRLTTFPAPTRGYISST